MYGLTSGVVKQDSPGSINGKWKDSVMCGVCRSGDIKGYRVSRGL